ncbi:MAG: hypothetical protein FWD38_11970 [Oscillospiraceae bacterium]|nr:hypothetical protein [Oscillospiraceae bacterium]
MPRRRYKRNPIVSLALAPISIPMKITNGILFAGGVIMIGGLLGAFSGSSKKKNRGEFKYYGY